MKLPVNEGKLDRTIRIGISLILLAGAFYSQNWWLLLLAVPLLATGIVGFCGIYTFFGINTCPRKNG